MSQFVCARAPDDMSDPRYMFATLAELTQSGAGVVAGLADAMLIADTNYKAQFANPTADAHISHIDKSPVALRERVYRDLAETAPQPASTEWIIAQSDDRFHPIQKGR